MDPALTKFATGLTEFQAILEELAAGVKKDRAELTKASEQLELEKAQFQEESQRVQFVVNEVEQVTLNVGGLKFTTTVTTLKNAPFPSLFNAMFSGRHTLKKDSTGCFFIDRDGRYFHDILNFLRDGRFNYPPDGKDYKYLVELRAEAEFYGLLGLVALIDRYPYNISTVQRAATLNMEDSWMFEDGQVSLGAGACAFSHLLALLLLPNGSIGMQRATQYCMPAPASFASGSMLTRQQGHGFIMYPGDISGSHDACLLPWPVSNDLKSAPYSWTASNTQNN